MRNKKLEIPQQMWSDKRIRYEGKIIYGYILAKGFDRELIDLNVGEIQQTVPIKKQGLVKNLERLEHCKYIVFKEYDKGMFTIRLT